MVVEKKNPYKFTIGFKKHLESHKRVAEILNQTQDKAALIVVAILKYYGESKDEYVNNIDTLRPWIQEIIKKEILSVIHNMDEVELPLENHIKKENMDIVDLSAEYEEEFYRDEFEINITNLMDSFRL